MRAGKLPKRTDDVRQDALRELRWAMGGAGLTLDKVPMMTAVLELPVVAAAAGSAAPSAAPGAALAVLVRALDGLGDGLHARLLRNSLGVGYHGDAKDLTARRLEFVTGHNDAARQAGSRNILGETARATYHIEQQMLATLVTALGAGPEPRPPAAAVDTSWMTVEADITFRLCGRSGKEAEILHVIRALADGVDEMSVSYYCENESEGAPARLRVYEGGTLEEDRSVGRKSFRTARIKYPEPLRAGDTWRLRYDTAYPPSRDPDPFFMLSVNRPTETATIRVTFDRAELPVRVWRADGVVIGSGGGDPCDGTPLVPDATGHVATTFASLRPGHAYGVAWQWS